MQVQRTTNQQSFMATIKFERVPARLWKTVAAMPTNGEFRAETALKSIEEQLTNGKTQLRQVFGKHVEEEFINNGHEAPIAVQLGEDVFILHESRVREAKGFESVIKVLFGKNATEGSADITREGSIGNEVFDRVMHLIKSVIKPEK